jgi:hypothetical protein
MSGIEPTPTEKLLIDAGFENGWALAGEDLILWEHETEPPKPLKRPEA